MIDQNNHPVPDPAFLRDPHAPSSPERPGPIAPIRVAQAPPPPAPDLKAWLCRLLACNPLYLLSAALLLYSFYLVSNDRGLLAGEIPQLWFNLGSLQVYEAVLVATAIFLARKAVWYDSTLLVGLENLLVLVPFILLSQAGLIHLNLVWGFCAAAAVLAAGRMGLLKRCIAPLNLPPRLLAGGAILLAVNTALPVVYRMLHEGKFGTKPDWGGAYWTNQCVWWVLLPALAGLVLLVPAGLDHHAGKRWPERGWLPLGFVSLWLAGTALHLYCLDYVYDFDLRSDLIVPGLWALAWVLALRAPRWIPGLRPGWEVAWWLLPTIAPWYSTSQPWREVFLALSGLNAAFFAGIYFGGGRKVALHLSVISLLAVLAGMPTPETGTLIVGLNQGKVVLAAASLYLLTWLAFSRNAKLGLLGGLLAAFGTAQLSSGHWAVQAGFAFLLLHSLRWEDAVEEGAREARWVGAVAWAAHAIVWSTVCGGAWWPSLIAGLVLAVWLAARWLQHRWIPVAIPAAAGLILLSLPVQIGVTQVRTLPAGLLTVAASFLLFGLGTLAALAQHRWAQSAVCAPSHATQCAKEVT